MLQHSFDLHHVRYAYPPANPHGIVGQWHEFIRFCTYTMNNEIKMMSPDQVDFCLTYQFSGVITPELPGHPKL